MRRWRFWWPVGWRGSPAFPMRCWPAPFRARRARRSSSRPASARLPGAIVGYGVIAVAITSSAVIALAFARYVESFSGLPEPLSLIVILVLLSGVAMAGVRESVAFAALITVLEAGTLLVVIAAGAAHGVGIGRAAADVLAARRLVCCGVRCSAAPSWPSSPSSGLRTSRTWRRKRMTQHAPFRWPSF